VLKRLHEMAATTSFDGDLSALAAFRTRIADAGRRQSLITYSDLVAGVPMQIPNVAGGAPFELGVPEWLDLHRAIIGEYLFRLAAESFEEAGFFSSAIVVGKVDRMPSDGFRELLLKTGFIGSKAGDAWMKVWLDHVNKAYAFYGAPPP
jgi:hypothetical protein